MSFAHKIKVGVLRGGPSPEYEVSLKTGANILANLGEEYEPTDILISKDGVWHERGVERKPENVLPRLDLVINGLHGKYGEDGEVQRLLEHFKVPYTGSTSLASAIAMNKVAAKKIYRHHGLKTPASFVIPFEDLSKQMIRSAYESVPAPFIVKPSSAGSSVGVYLARSLPELEEAVVAAAEHSPAVLIEEMIEGKEATCGVIDHFRNTEHYPLIPIEIRHGRDLFDYAAKYSDPKNGGAEEICPGNFTPEESTLIKQLATEAHRAIHLRHYSRSDFIVHPRRGIYILETNTLPGLTETSLLPKSLQAVGSNIKEFLSHLINKALGKRDRV
jgi:D-alanine-D-alanine ligase